MTEAVVSTPLVVEHRALAAALAPIRVQRTGAGPARSTRYAEANSECPHPMLVAGVGGSLARHIQPGDLVVASEILFDGARIESPSAPLLATALRRQGLTVHVGPIVSSPKVVHGAQRRALAESGALAVDMESAQLSAAAAGGPFAVVRAIVDTPDHALLRPGTVPRALKALSMLRATAPAIRDWVAATATRQIMLASPRSFCAGVERAIEIVERAIKQYGAPVYVRRQIVHNAHVVRDLEDRGAVFVEELDEVPAGALVVLAAHGVSPVVRAEAAARELSVIDATCPLVNKVHSEVRRYVGHGDTVFLIGHSDHEEVVGTVGEAPDSVVVVGNLDEARRVEPRDGSKVAYVMQTTLAVDEAAEIADVLRGRFPALSAPRRDDICYATTNRQQAVRAVARSADLVIVVGSPNSSNSRRLVEVAEREGAPAYLVDDAAEIDLRWLAEARTIGITAGASAPPHLVEDVVHCLSGLGDITIQESHVVDENVQFTLPREVS